MQASDQRLATTRVFLSDKPVAGWVEHSYGCKDTGDPRCSDDWHFPLACMVADRKTVPARAEKQREYKVKFVREGY